MEQTMTRNIFCAKLKQDAQGLDFLPYPGELGNKIYQQISKEAWQQWQAQQTMLINEYRLNLSEASAREFLATEMEKYLFGDGSQAPAGYTPPQT